jgi:hypothetical protein
VAGAGSATTEALAELVPKIDSHIIEHYSAISSLTLFFEAPGVLRPPLVRVIRAPPQPPAVIAHPAGAVEN